MTVITHQELIQFYASLGQAVHLTQNVEGSLQRLACLAIDFQRKRHSPSEAAIALEKYRKLTLGELIKRLSKANALDERLEASLGKLNEERKFVVHRMQESTAQHLRANPQFRSSLLVRLDSVSSLASAAHAHLTDFILAKYGPTVDRETLETELLRTLRAQKFI